MSEDTRYNVVVLLVAAVIVWAWLEFRWHRRQIARLDYLTLFLHDGMHQMAVRQQTAETVQ